MALIPNTRDSIRRQKSLSTTLPEDAPTSEPAAPSVEDPAPGSAEAVAEDSVDTAPEPKMVPADRFNGLMGRFHQTQSELEAERERVAALEARLNERDESQTEATPPVAETDTSSLEARVNELSQLLISERLEGARSRAIAEYPEAAPFADLIVADTPDDIREMTRLIAERVQTASQAASGTQEPPAPEAGSEDGSTEGSPEPEGSTDTGSVEPPVVGGGAAYSGEASADDRVTQAIDSGNFTDFLQAKWEKQSVEAGGDLPVG